MPASQPGHTDLDEVRELNRLLIEFLRADTAPTSVYGLEAAALAALRSAPPELVDAAAGFPHALFEIRLGDGQPGPDSAAGSPDPARHALELTILHSAWNMSRQNPSAARLLLGLDEPAIRTLRTTTLYALAQRARAGNVLSCAFPESTWVWQGLFTETRTEVRRQLLLIALQPRVPEMARARPLFAQHASA